ncbi:sensor histidine kinase, partial [Hyalangium sp.]|uniref:sensor histidine kinase n=1 Tax=Hyalangium sp. TaxID=2028555 RepID=UPI002D5AC4BB
NLVSNAVKYTAGRPSACVSVHVSQVGGEAVLQVGDNGIGMSVATRGSLFQPFFRAPEARGLPGHGLGLATAKRLVEAHGGTLSVQSQEGMGTTMTVRFPRASPAVAAGSEVALPARRVAP